MPAKKLRFEFTRKEALELLRDAFESATKSWPDPAIIGVTGKRKP